jgi:hypothetical protein
MWHVTDANIHSLLKENTKDDQANGSLADAGRYHGNRNDSNRTARLERL